MNEVDRRLVESSRRNIAAMILANQERVGDEGEMERKLSAITMAQTQAIALADEYYARGYIRTELEAAASANLWMSFGSDDRPSERTRLYTAFRTDATRIFWEFIKDRSDRHDGKSNVTVEFRGRTGTGKSSAAMTVAESLGLEAGMVPQAVHFYPRPWLRAVTKAWEAKKAGEPHAPVQLLDEETSQVGDGSRTKDSLVRNQEATLRQTGINMIFNAANKVGDMTRDVTIQMVGLNPDTAKLRGICYMDVEGTGQASPVGYVDFDFCDKDTWGAYTILKEAALDLAAAMGGMDGAIKRAYIAEFLLDTDAFGRMDRGGWSETVVRAECEDELAGQFTSNETHRIVQGIKEIGLVYSGEDIAPFVERLADLEQKGFAWEPDNMDNLATLVRGQSAVPA